MARRWIAGLLMALLLAACGGTAASLADESTGIETQFGAAASMDGDAPAEAAPVAPEDGAAREEGEQAGGDTTANPISDPITAGAPVQQGEQRMVIRDATVAMLVDQVDQVEAQVRQIADERGGWVLGSQASGEGDERRATISFKVPAEHFDDALNTLTGLARKVDTLDVKGQDVTSEFVDLQSRLRNLQAVEQRLLQFLAEARNTEDALAVNEQLTVIQAQIEESKGRIAYLEQSAAYSTITVSLYAPAVVSIESEPRWSPSNTAAAAANNLLDFAKGLADIAIVFAIWTPLWLPLLLLVLWTWRRARRTPARPSPPPATT